MKRTLLTFAAILIAGAVASPAFADDKADSDQIFNEGLALYEKKDLEGARERFAAAYAKYPSPNSLFNLARVEQVLGKNIEAYRHFRAYSELPDNPRVTEADRAESKQRMQEILSKVGRIVVLAPQGAKVVIDGAPQENATEAIPVEPGPHTVDLVIENETRTRKLECHAGEIHQAKWDEGGGLLPGEQPKPMSPLVPAGLVLVGVGAIGLIGGLAFGVLSSGKASDAKASVPGECVDQTTLACQSLQSSADSANTFNTVSIVSYVVGGVLVAGGVVMTVMGLTKKKGSAEPQQRSWLLPSVGPNGAGFNYLVHF